MARCNMTPESLPIEYNMTGLRNSAGTSRMMPIDSASRRFKWTDRAGRVVVLLIVRRLWGQGYQMQLAAGNEMGIAQPALTVGHGGPTGGQHTTARGDQHRLSGGGIPFHGGSETRIEIGLPRRD